MKLITFLASRWLDLAVAMALVVATWMLRKFLSQKRASALKAVAARLGLTFSGDDWSRAGRAPQLETPLFERGRDKAFSNIMAGNRAGLESSFFDYSFGRGRKSTQQTLATFSQDSWLPLFEIAPKNIASRLSDAILHRDIHIESHPSFSSRFRVRGSEEIKIRALLRPGLLSYLERLDPKMKWHVEGCGLTLVIYRLGKIVKPEQFATFVDETSATVRTFLTLSGLKTFR